MAHVYVYKAQPLGDQRVQSKTIHIEETFPTTSGIRESDALMMENADKLERALHSLPGGIYDRLLGLMLKRKASHFIVSHTWAEEATND